PDDQRGGMGPRRNIGKARLGVLWHGLWQLEGSAAPLSEAQAKRMVNLVRPWSNKPSMTESQAKSLTASLNAVLTASQRNVVGDLNEPGPRGRGGFGPPPGRGDGPPPGHFDDGPPRNGSQGDRSRGDRPRGDRPRGDGPRGDRPRPGRPTPAQAKAMGALMERLNPFYSPTGYKEFKTMPLRMRQGLVRRYQESRATLIALSRKAA
ncbi:MAG: hypothetical protein JWN98_184, partial [Abditibacteriota bacterium]|nr:hypothetical protein [Abditibacteriota bacterium]